MTSKIYRWTFSMTTDEHTGEFDNGLIIWFNNKLYVKKDKWIFMVVRLKE